jgi:zinc protease
VLGNYMLGGSGLKSRLMARIRIKDGLSYGGSSQIQADPFDKSGGFLSYWIHAPQNRDKVEAAFKEEIARALAEDFTEQELADAKSGWMQGRSVGRSQNKELVRGLAGKTYLDRTTGDADRRGAGAGRGDHRAALAKIAPAKFTTGRQATREAAPAPPPAQ